MKNFRKVINSIDFSLDNVLIFNVLLNSITLHLFAVLILGLFSQDVSIAFLLSTAYLIIGLSLILFRPRNIQSIEEKHQELNEKLRTAADNADKENAVVDELHREVIDELKNVRVSIFLHERKASFKMAIAIVLCFGILATSMIDAKIIGMNLYVNNNPVFSQNKTIRIVNNKVILAELNQSDEIYGEDELAKLGDVELGIRVKPADFEVDVSEEGEVEEKRFDETFPSEVFVETGTVYEENIPVDQQELVKNYFKKLAES